MVVSEVWDHLKRSNRLAKWRIDRPITLFREGGVDRLFIFAARSIGLA
jgi:hypothetical protein